MKIKYGASLNDVPDLKHMPLTFNEIQMHKTGTDGKRNSESLCWFTAQPSSNIVRRQGRYEKKWRPSKTGEPFVSWFHLPTGGPPPRQTFTTKSEVSSMTDYQADGLAGLVLMMMNFCVGLHVHLT
jgi:hypothetical protein